MLPVSRSTHARQGRPEKLKCKILHLKEKTVSKGEPDFKTAELERLF